MAKELKPVLDYLLDNQHQNDCMMVTEPQLNEIVSYCKALMETHVLVEKEKPVKDTEDLQALMRDPRYWRDKDPEFVAKVTEGFQKLYNPVLSKGR